MHLWEPALNSSLGAFPLEEDCQGGKKDLLTNPAVCWGNCDHLSGQVSLVLSQCCFAPSRASKAQGAWGWNGTTVWAWYTGPREWELRWMSFLSGEGIPLKWRKNQEGGRACGRWGPPPASGQPLPTRLWRWNWFWCLRHPPQTWWPHPEPLCPRPSSRMPQEPWRARPSPPPGLRCNGSRWSSHTAHSRCRSSSSSASGSSWWGRWWACPRAPGSASTWAGRPSFGASGARRPGRRTAGSWGPPPVRWQGRWAKPRPPALASQSGRGQTPPEGSGRRRRPSRRWRTSGTWLRCCPALWPGGSAGEWTGLGTTEWCLRCWRKSGTGQSEKQGVGEVNGSAAQRGRREESVI